MATRLFSAGGAGGIAFTIWALRAAGMAARTVGRSSIAAFLAIMYAPYVAACLLGGLGGGAPAAVDVGRRRRSASSRSAARRC